MYDFLYIGSYLGSYTLGLISYPIILPFCVFGYYKLYYIIISKKRIKKYINDCNYHKFNIEINHLKNIDQSQKTSYYTKTLEIYNIDENLISNEELFTEKFYIKKILKDII